VKFTDLEPKAVDGFMASHGIEATTDRARPAKL
jgi:hypothetical protein